MGGNEEHPLLR